MRSIRLRWRGFRNVGRRRVVILSFNYTNDTRRRSLSLEGLKFNYGPMITARLIYDRLSCRQLSGLSLIRNDRKLQNIILYLVYYIIMYIGEIRVRYNHTHVISV